MATKMRRMPQGKRQDEVEKDSKTGRPLTRRQKLLKEREERRKQRVMGVAVKKTTPSDSKYRILEKKALPDGRIAVVTINSYGKKRVKLVRGTIVDAKPKIKLRTSFTKDDVIKLCNENAEFRKITETGHYIYASDNRLYLFHPAYIQVGTVPGEMILSEEASNNPELYCLSSSVDSSGNITFHHPKKYLEMISLPFDVQEYVDYYDEVRINPSNGGTNGGGGGTSLYDGADGEYFEPGKSPDIGQNPPPPINRLKTIIMEYIDKQDSDKNSINKFASYIHVDPATISRFWTRPESRPAIESVMAVCLGLHMTPTDSAIVVYLCGYCLRDIPQEHAYKTLLNDLYYLDIVECNHYLMDRGLRAMTGAT